MRILWITGWYPNDNSPYEGDFIQRQARSASLFHSIHVLYVSLSRQNFNSLHEKKVNDNLVESVYSAPLPGGLLAKNNITKQIIYFLHIQKRFNDYLKRFGPPDIIHIHIPLKLSLFGLWIKYKYKIPLIISEHWGIYDSSVSHNINHQSFFKRYFLRSFLRSADRIISVSHYLGEGMKKFAKLHSYQVINNVVDTSLFRYIYHRNDKVKTVVHISDMDEVKNPMGILQVIQQVLQKRIDIRFVIIGVKSDKYEKVANELGIGHQYIQYIKEIPYTDVAIYLQKSNALFMFSFAETFSCVTAEALCCGIPVAAVNKTAFSELINENNGILSKDYNVNTMTNALLNLIDNPLWDHEQISADAISKYSFKKIGEEISLMYEQVFMNYHKSNY
jgi:glycosyltransferase involved in cell wall biosynthesis